MLGYGILFLPYYISFSHLIQKIVVLVLFRFNQSQGIREQKKKKIIQKELIEKNAKPVISYYNLLIYHINILFPTKNIYILKLLNPEQRILTN